MNPIIDTIRRSPILASAVVISSLFATMIVVYCLIEVRELDERMTVKIGDSGGQAMSKLGLKEENLQMFVMPDGSTRKSIFWGLRKRGWMHPFKLEYTILLSDEKENVVDEHVVEIHRDISFHPRAD